jgi:hypothetical protein
MRSVRIGIIAGMVGAFVGAVSTYYYLSDSHRTVSSLADVGRVEGQLLEVRTGTSPYSSNDKWARDSVIAHRDRLPMASMTSEPSVTASPRTVEMENPDPVKEEAMVQAVMSRLYDPSMTITDIMQSEEMYKLSDESRERVVARMVELLNRGEIDARLFMSSDR